MTILYRQASHQRPVPQGATVSNSESHRGTNVRLPYVDGERATELWTSALGFTEDITYQWPWTYTTSSSQSHMRLKALKHSLMLLPSLISPRGSVIHIYISDKCFSWSTWKSYRRVGKKNFSLHSIFKFLRLTCVVNKWLAEAMRVSTKVVKAEFPHRADDFYTRGAWCNCHASSYTSVGFTCLEAAQKLQNDYLPRANAAFRLQVA